MRIGGKNSSNLDLVHVRKMGSQVSVALISDQVLAGRFTVVSEHFVDHVHTADDRTKGGESLAVESSVVGIVDEDLGRTSIGAGGSEDEASAFVALNDRIILDFGGVPDLIDGGVGAESELNNESRNDAEEGRIGEVAVTDQVVEAVHAEGRPVAMDFNDEVARSGGELCLKDRGRLEL